ncbi:MAG: hypothetical protein OQK12_09630 [Motiliproteus sp.]|nr:hypothetical protein [Motiliproteus sp.]MCW9050864.1 hypothetical protein [Motiliproteus sp.]
MDRVLLQLLRCSLCFMVAVVLSMPVVVNAGHNPLAQDQHKQQRHQFLSGTADTDATHFHKDGSPEEQKPSHQHGHNPADHLHESAHPLSQYPLLSESENSILADYNHRYLSLLQPPPTQPPQR